MGLRLRRTARCFNCGLDYARKQHEACPRCAETRVIKSGGWFPRLEDSFEIGEMSKSQAGHAIPDMKRRERESARAEAEQRRPEDGAGA